jgi:thiosulfate/3-mercaptopyruvate sulfurtransferase
MHIPGAVLFDLEEISDRSSSLPHMIAKPEDFARAVGAMGIGDDDRVVVYDHLGVMSAARVWWNFRVMGHDQVYVLDGGLPRWYREARPTEDGLPPEVEPKTFTPRYRPELVRHLDQLKAAMAEGVQVVDARPAPRFRGLEPEPRSDVPAGHIPGSRNVPHPSLLSDGLMLNPIEIEARFRAAGVDPDKPVIATCGSGVTAATVALALARLGHWDTPVYDGSWTEWATQKDAPIAKG